MLFMWNKNHIFYFLAFDIDIKKIMRVLYFIKKYSKVLTIALTSFQIDKESLDGSNFRAGNDLSIWVTWVLLRMFSS